MEEAIYRYNITFPRFIPKWKIVPRKLIFLAASRAGLREKGTLGELVFCAPPPPPCPLAPPSPNQQCCCRQAGVQGEYGGKVEWHGAQPGSS